MKPHSNQRRVEDDMRNEVAAPTLRDRVLDWLQRKSGNTSRPFSSSSLWAIICFSAGSWLYYWSEVRDSDESLLGLVLLGVPATFLLGALCVSSLGFIIDFLLLPKRNLPGILGVLVGGAVGYWRMFNIGASELNSPRYFVSALAVTNVTCLVGWVLFKHVWEKYRRKKGG